MSAARSPSSGEATAGAVPGHGLKPEALKQLARRLTLACTGLALALALLAGAGHFYLVYQGQQQSTQLAARLLAESLLLGAAQAEKQPSAGQAIHGQAAQSSTAALTPDGLARLLQPRLPGSELPEQRTVLKADGSVAAQAGDELPWPVLVQSVAIAGALQGHQQGHQQGHHQGRQLGHQQGQSGQIGQSGQVQVARSLQPLLFESALVLALAGGLGLLLHWVLNRLPVQALRNAAKALKHERARALAHADAQLRAVFEQTTDGLLLLDERGFIRSCNPAAATMLGRPAHSLLGQSLLAAVRLEPDSDSEPLKPGHRERVSVGQVGQVRHLELSVSDTRLDRTRQRMALLRDVTHLTEQNQRLAQMAAFDALTGLPNRAQFKERLGHAMQRAQASGQQMALMFLDLDRFKTINDSLGHAVGDQLLIQVARRLEHCLHVGGMVNGAMGAAAAGAPTPASAEGPNLGRRASDRLPAAAPGQGAVRGTVFRLGGDEFTVLLEGLQDPQPATAMALRILSAFSTPVRVGEENLFASTSIGITLFPQDANDQEGLIKQADMAMYRSKAMGRDTYHFFHQDMQVHAKQRHALEAALHQALERQEFGLVYQPKVDLRSGRITGVEALLRWHTKEAEACGPDKFIPVLEETGLIVSVGHWVLLQACQQMMQWRRQGLNMGRLAVNLSARQFRHQGLLQQVAQVLHTTGMQPQWLELELTESMLLVDGDETVRIMKSLNTMGVQLAIDDFGTGHSSLSYLKRFDVDTLKIDRSFIRDTPNDPDDCAIAKAVIALGHSLKLRVVAEGVENEQQVAFLREQACDEIQGYFFSRPQTSQQLAAWVSQRQPASVTKPAELAQATASIHPNSTVATLAQLGGFVPEARVATEQDLVLGLEITEVSEAGDSVIQA